MANALTLITIDLTAAESFMKSKIPTSLNIAYLHEYHIIFDLALTLIRQELNINTLDLHYYPTTESLLQMVKKDEVDIVFIHYSCLFNGVFRISGFKDFISKLCYNKRVITVLFTHKLKPELLKKITMSGLDIVIGFNDKPDELLNALQIKLMSPGSDCYVSRMAIAEGQLPQNHVPLTAKEWEVIYMINQGFSLTQIALKKCRAKSTISTQKRTAMDKLHLKSESELLRYLHQNTYF